MGSMYLRLLAVLLVLGAFVPFAHAANWPTLPVACTPDRASKWDPNKSEPAQENCHCPPTSLCPTSYAEYKDTSKYKMPTQFVNRCCPVIAPPVCAAGTYYANQPVPADGDCNPALCPAGTQHAGEPQKLQTGGDCGQLCPAGSKLAGQLLPADKNCNPVAVCPSGSDLAGQPVPANGQCSACQRDSGGHADGGIGGYKGSSGTGGGNTGTCSEVCPAGTSLAGKVKPADGNCNPGQAVQCPSKYYPSLSDSKTSSEPNGYSYQDGSRYLFDKEVGITADVEAKKPDWSTKALSARYGYSLRKTSLAEWVHGPKYCTFWNIECFIKTGFSPLSNNVNDGYQSLQSLVGRIGADNATWYGISLLPINGLADNYAPPAVVNEIGARDRIQIADFGAGSAFVLDSQNDYAAPAFNSTIYPVGPAMKQYDQDFITQCLSVGGEYVELERKSVNGNQCAYLQCRYVYTAGGMESCLAGGTKVTLGDGTAKAVQDVTVGDVVLGEDGPHKVTAKNAYQSGLRVLYGINGGGEMITGDHPIKTTDGWKVITEQAANAYAAKPGFAKTKLAVGDKIITRTGEVVVKEIRRFAKVDPVSTYNLQVEGDGNFYANGIEVKGFHKMEMHYE